MPGRRIRPSAAWALAGIAVLLVVGLGAIFRARIATGELYPPYSSLRSDPSGTALLFQALTKTGRFHSITRVFQPLRDSGVHDATVLFLGCHLSGLNLDSDAGLKDWERTAQPGNRVVIAIDSDSLPFPVRPTIAPRPDKPETPLKKRWHIQIARSPSGQETWPFYFSSAEGWTVIFTIDDRPVMIERPFGAGTLVFSLGSSMFINRFVAGAQHDDMLAWLIGSKPSIVFDEEHLGIADSGTLLGLAHRYRLTGLLWGLVILALAFIWNQSVGFPPPLESQAVAIAGRTSRSGLIQLLRGQIVPANLIATCISEWNRVHPKTKLEGVPESDPVESYRAIQNQLTSR